MSSREATQPRAASAAPRAAPYVFPGMGEFLRASAEDAGADPTQVLRALATWHVGQIQDTLGQLPAMPASARDGAMASVMLHRDSLALAVVAVDEAISEACTALGITPAKSIHDGPKRSQAAKKG